jgi:hypothetical protein
MKPFTTESQRRHVPDRRLSPAGQPDLLNRIVPLENGAITCVRTGQTIVVPFRELIVFSTNLDPYKLADDAFYRRIQMKVGVFSPDEERFRTIFLESVRTNDHILDEMSCNYLLDQMVPPDWSKALQSVHPMRYPQDLSRQLCQLLTKQQVRMTP